MSDSSSMMMVVAIGGSMACAMSCVGSLAGWYLYDPTLNGLIKDTSDTYGGTTTDDSTTSDDTNPSSSASGDSVPQNRKTSIFSFSCSNESRAATLLSASTQGASNGVGMWCKSEKNNVAKWTLTPTNKSKYPTYYIKNSGYYGKYYLSTDQNALVLSKTSKKKWKVSRNNKSEKTFSIQEADGAKAYLSVFVGHGCRFGVKGGVYLSADKDNSHWKFKPEGSNASTGSKDVPECVHSQDKELNA